MYINQVSALNALLIVYAVFALPVLCAFTLTATSQPQLGFWATFKAAFKTIEKVLFATLILIGGFLFLMYFGVKVLMIN